MSVEAITWAYKQDVKSSMDKFVLVTLCNWASEDWIAYPSVSGLAEKTGMDRKTVLAALKRLAEAGFIEDTSERMGQTKQIVVWKVVEDSQKRNGSENGTVPNFPANSTENGTLKQSQKRDTDTKDKPYTKEDTKEHSPESAKKSRRVSKEITLRSFLENCKAVGEKPIPENHAVITYAHSIGLPKEMLVLAWQGFKARYLDDPKTYKDWRQTFYNAVKGNWMKYWYTETTYVNGEAQLNFNLTTAGQQAQMEFAHA
jgi:DNA-binding transcriptional ArsR family regulator